MSCIISISCNYAGNAFFYLTSVTLFGAPRLLCFLRMYSEKRKSFCFPPWLCFYKELPPNDPLPTIDQRRQLSPSWIRKGQSLYSLKEKVLAFEQTQPSRSPLKSAMKKQKKAIDWRGRFKAWITKYATAIGSLTLVNALKTLQ